MLRAEPVRFHFDPICPWCYQTLRWIRRLAELGVVEVDWAVFSLAMANAGNLETRAKRHDRSERALRTVVAVREQHGREAVGEFYAQLGRRVHERGEPLDEPATIEAALVDAGLDPELCEKAMSDDGTQHAVEAEHQALVERTRSFGVPTLVLDGGEGPAMFGPVISTMPSDDDAVELWRHTSWLIRYQAFAELKRDRTDITDLESVRQR
jgi:protein-disulfide isomerase-like protein with CxxC motif